MLRSMENLVAEAAIALTMFVASTAGRLDPRAEWERNAQIRNEADISIREQVGERYYQDHDQVRLEVDRLVLKRRSEMGLAPRTYEHKVPFIHAHTFVYAVDSFEKFLEELSDYELPDVDVGKLRDAFNTQLPMVRKIRNSALHIEDRSRRYASLGDKRKGKKMEVGFLGLSNLENDYLCYTIDDGSYQRIAINAETLGIMGATINGLLRLFVWKGPPQLLPS